jgi:hypothetical protein
MQTLTHEIVTPIPVQLLFGGCPIDPDLLDAAMCADDPDIDEKLLARCSSL